MVVGVKVIKLDGTNIGYGKAFVRYLCSFISFLTLCIGYLLAAFHSQKRALHDLICGTKVIHTEATLSSKTRTILIIFFTAIAYIGTGVFLCYKVATTGISKISKFLSKYHFKLDVKKPEGEIVQPVEVDEMNKVISELKTAMEPLLKNSGWEKKFFEFHPPIVDWKLKETSFIKLPSIHHYDGFSFTDLGSRFEFKQIEPVIEIPGWEIVASYKLSTSITHAGTFRDGKSMDLLKR